MFKDKYGILFGEKDFILFTRHNDHRMHLGEIAAIKRNWGYLLTDCYSFGKHDKLELIKGRNRIIKIDDPILIAKLKASPEYKLDVSNLHILYEKLNK
jgi:hypothetical protein